MPDSTVISHEEYDIVVVGGGIAGLYCLHKLVQAGRNVKLFESSSRLGGRIETWRVDDELYAEFGPMRIEPEKQSVLKNLLNDLGITDTKNDEEDAIEGELIPFPAYKSEEATELTFNLTTEEGKQKTVLELLMFALRCIFQLLDSPIEWHGESKERKKHHFNLMIDEYFVRRKYWKGEFQEWVQLLDEKDFQKIREASIDETPLYDMGFWNVLSDVLSHMAVVKIRDWGSFYHLLPENPNAAEWIIFWLRAFQTSNALRGIKGGMDQIVKRIKKRLPGEDKYITTCKELVKLKQKNVEQVTLTFSDKNGGSTSVDANHVILALPKRPLEKLAICFEDEQIRKDIDAVFGFPLLKCFFVVDQPFWEDDRKPNRYASQVPTRELHYWKNKQGTKGLIMVYTDRPGTQFWTDYLDSGEQTKAAKWPEKNEEEDRTDNAKLRHKRLI